MNECPRYRHRRRANHTSATRNGQPAKHDVSSARIRFDECRWLIAITPLNEKPAADD